MGGLRNMIKEYYCICRRIVRGVGLMAIIMSLGITMTACGSKPEADETMKIAETKYPESLKFEDFDGRRKVSDENPVDKKFLESVKDFSFNTASKVLEDGSENVLYSPLSLYYALAICGAGSKGETEKELLDLLGVKDKDYLAEQSGNLYRLLYRDSEIGKIKIANSLWLDDEVNGMSYTYDKEFLKSIADEYYSSVYSVDFEDENTGDLIGYWINSNTQGGFDYNYVPNNLEAMRVINTIYLYDEWVDRFSKSKTKKDDFNIDDNTKVSCDFMNRTYGSHAFHKGEGFTRSSLSLKEAGRMIFILPDKDVDIKQIVSDPDALRKALFEGDNTMGEVVWKLPKFSFGNSIDLVESLEKLGIKNIFSSKANFTGFTDGPLWISNITQNTHIGIDEKGVEAKAFTEICYAGECPPQDRADMILDRPFLYALTGMGNNVYFIGVCKNPIE